VKRIALKVYESSDGKPELRTVEILRHVTRQPLDKAKGIEIEEMRQSVKVLDALDRANGTLELEDREWETLRDKMVAMTWGVVDARLIEVYESVTLATDQVPLNDQV
jgi:hypothetical protein